MKSILTQLSGSFFWLILLTAIIKIPLFFTNNIQEDSFITWRVAGNLLDYGVVGFNGEERISASTTHFYVLITAFFRLLFGDYFIYPLLIFSGILFAIGSIWLGKILFPKEILKRGFFVLFINMVPPALTASCLGMEYGILFFLYNGLIYFGIFKGKNWAYFLFPILLLWTRIDAAIFLGIFFLADLILRKKLNFVYIFGGIVGLVTVVGFNYFYFGEWINHTITAKKIAYKNLIQNNSLEYFLYQWAYYGGLIKKYSLFTFLIFVGFLGFLGFVAFEIFKNRKNSPRERTVILFAILVFALTKITVFAYFKAYFDWYYWLPRVFLFGLVLYYFLEFSTLKKNILIPVLALFILSFYCFQLAQSYAIGYMEKRQRMQISSDLNKKNTGIEHSILLEPAGIIPFYTGLYTYDEVGLVNKRINDEMQKDENFWWINSVKKYRPTYILTIAKEAGTSIGMYKMSVKDQEEFQKNYILIQKYPISKIHQNAPEILKWIYKVRPIGKDYFLYENTNELRK